MEGWGGQVLLSLWKLVPPGSRRSFLLLGLVVAAGGLVELAGIATVAQMMKLVASHGQTAGQGPLEWGLELLGCEAPGQRLRVGLTLTLGILLTVHGYSALRSYLRSRFVWIQDREISSRLFSATLGRPYGWFLQRNSSELQHLLLSGQAVQRLLSNLLSAVSQIAVAGTLTLALLWTDPLVALGGGLVVVLAYAAVRWGTHHLLSVAGAEAHLAERARRKISQEALTSIRFVKTTGRESFFVQRFTELSERASRGMVYHGIYVDLVRAFLEWVSFAGILSLSVYLLLNNQNFEQLLPRLTLYTMASYRIIPAIHDLFGLWSRLRFDQRYLHDLEELLAGPPVEESESVSPLELPPSEPLVRLEQVGFRYPNSSREILRLIDLEVAHHEWIGVVGSTGAGKTTLLDVITGLVEPTEGRVGVGGTPLDGEVGPAWRRRLAVVPQEVILLDESLLRNVAFGHDDAAIDRERVLEVCRAAGLQALLEQLPEGLETPLGERGTRLSGGERQRVGLARALYLRPALLLLDEATSALDQATEATLVATLRELTRQCTLITVAHRLSSVQPCHRIVVLEEGRLVAQGSYQQLLESSPAFRQLALVQAP